MIDLRPVGYVIGLMVLGLGAAMIAPALFDLFSNNADWRAFLISAVLTVLVGGALTLGSASRRDSRIAAEHAFLIVVFAWVLLPVFGALPFIFGAPQATPIDALFESVSGLTTTGSTIFANIDVLPPGIQLWRALLQWVGGVGIVIFAMLFLPMLQVGGMQIFRTEAFDTHGKMLPRVRSLAAAIAWIYIGLTAACALAYGAAGMGAFDALCHSMTTIATGGFANYDASFNAFGVGAQYVAILFMLLASLPFIQYVQFVSGEQSALLRDPQVRGFLIVVAVAWGLLLLGRIGVGDEPLERTARQALFNMVSLLTGTGYSSADYNAWGPFAISVLFTVGLIGGCAGSTSCSVKIFRFQVLLAVAKAELQRLRRPSGVFTPRYHGHRIGPEVITSVLTFLAAFLLSLVLLAVALTWTGLDLATSISGAATALANVGPGFGGRIGPLGNFSTLPESAKSLLIIGMLLGRLELLSVLVILTPSFWRR